MFAAVMLGMFLGVLGTFGIIALAAALITKWIRRAM